MNCITTLFKTALSRAEFVIALTPLLELDHAHSVSQVRSLCRAAEQQRRQLESRPLDLSAYDERQLALIKVTVLKLIALVLAFLQNKGCRFEESVKLNRSMDLRDILAALTAMSETALSTQLAQLATKRRQRCKSGCVSRSVLQHLEYLKYLHLTFLLREHTYASYHKAHFENCLPTRIEEQPLIYSWIARVLRQTRMHQPDSSSVIVAEERVILISDFFGKRTDILLADALERNAHIHAQLTRHARPPYHLKLPTRNPTPP